LYKFSDKKNREDVIALRWPKACLSCGAEMPEDTHPRHAIVGTFYVDKKTHRGDRRHTQVLVKLPGFFYMCMPCEEVINSAFKTLPKNMEKLVETLQESPWMEFIEVEKNGVVKLPKGRFKERLREVNPDAWLKSKTCPMTELKRQMKE
jgi:hypothetical protein